MIDRLTLIFTVILIFIFVLIIRVERFVGIETEEIPYKKYFDNYSILETLNKESNIHPFRTGAVGKIIPAAIQKYGIETADGRGAFFNKFYKDYFKLIINQQLKTKEQRDFFDNYWYNLYFLNGDGSLDFNFPLLLLMNVKYLISSKYEPDLAKVSSQIIYSEPDNTIFYKNFKYFNYESLEKVFMKILGSFDSPLFKYIKSQAKDGDILETIISRMDASPIYIYELKDYFERGFLVKNAVVLNSDKEVLENLSTQTVQDLREKVFFSSKDCSISDLLIYKQIHTSIFSQNEIKMIYYSPDKIVFDVLLDTPAILVVTNNYHPKWVAKVNGQKTKVYRANHAFQSVILKDPGKYTVTFEYKDPILWILHGSLPLGIILINFALLSKFYKKQSSSVIPDKQRISFTKN